MSKRVLLVEPEPAQRAISAAALGAVDYEVELAASFRSAQRLLAEGCFDVVILNPALADGDGLTLIEQLRQGGDRRGEAVVIALTAGGDTAGVVRALRAGADSHLARPVEVRELLLLLGRALETRKLRALVGHLRDSGLITPPSSPNGASTAMRTTLERLDQVAAARDTTVLIQGESGTGKDVLARLLHRRTPGRSAGPFVVLDCTGVPAQLLESELFGHARGAFTDAARERAGLLEAADGGTLFLDEIGDLTLPLQAKLLRVLETGSYRPLGATSDRRADVRFVAATHRDLAGLVAAGAFRLDLFHRLDVFRLEVLPLRERPEDILPLAEQFLAEFAARLGRPLEGFTEAAREALLGYAYPGNVRELRNAIERAVILETESRVGLGSLTLGRPPADPAPTPARERPPTLDELERDYLFLLLEYAQGNRTQVARLMGVSYPTAVKKIAEHGLDLSRWKVH